MSNKVEDQKSGVKSPSMDGMELVPKLGGMPKKKDVEEIIKANSPNSRKAAPDSFRPNSPGTGDREGEE
jgi:hypothetical protein